MFVFILSLFNCINFVFCIHQLNKRYKSCSKISHNDKFQIFFTIRISLKMVGKSGFCKTSDIKHKRTKRKTIEQKKALKKKFQKFTNKIISSYLCFFDCSCE